MLPLVSIIVPVYKVEPYLKKCLDSIVNQTWKEIEIILIDDGSPDNCGRICDEYAIKDKRIKVFHKQNGGLSDARNYGIERANGEYLVLVDSDDWIELDMIETLVIIAEENKADLVICGVFNEYPDQLGYFTPDNKKYSNNIDLTKALLNGKVCEGVSNKLYRKCCFTNITFPKGRVYEEFSTTYRICLNVVSSVSISKHFYHYRLNRIGAITQTRSMKNLVDYWLAHKIRYNFFLHDSRFNKDSKLMEKLLKWCAEAIERTWLNIYTATKMEKDDFSWVIKEMQDFLRYQVPIMGLKNWPLHLRFTIFMARFNNDFVFALLYFMCQGYKKITRLR